LAGRTEATGFGGVVVLKELVDRLGLKPQNQTVAVQGFGNVGQYFARFAADSGFKVVAVSDSKGAITEKNHQFKILDIPLVLKCKMERGLSPAVIVLVEFAIGPKADRLPTKNYWNFRLTFSFRRLWKTSSMPRI